MIISAFTNGIDFEKSAEEVNDSPDNCENGIPAVADMGARLENNQAAIVADVVPVVIGMNIFIVVRFLMTRNVFVALVAEIAFRIADFRASAVLFFNIFKSMNTSVIGGMCYA